MYYHSINCALSSDHLVPYTHGVSEFSVCYTAFRGLNLFHLPSIRCVCVCALEHLPFQCVMMFTTYDVIVRLFVVLL
jgi:hypothetical protein